MIKIRKNGRGPFPWSAWCKECERACESRVPDLWSAAATTQSGAIAWSDEHRRNSGIHKRYVERGRVS